MKSESYMYNLNEQYQHTNTIHKKSEGPTLSYLERMSSTFNSSPNESTMSDDEELRFTNEYIRPTTSRLTTNYSFISSYSNGMTSTYSGARPSLLDFRASRHVRPTKQFNGPPLNRPTTHTQMDPTRRLKPSGSQSEPELTHVLLERGRGISSVSSVGSIAVMDIPVEEELPLLDYRDGNKRGNNQIIAEEEVSQETDVDRIRCDASRMTHMKFVDEDGHSIGRNSFSSNSISQTSSLSNSIGQNSPSLNSHNSYPLSASQTSGSLRSGDIMKEGLVFYQTHRFAPLRNRWKVRYVVLTHTHLLIYREENGRLRKSVKLSDCQEKSIEIMPSDSVFDGKQATLWRFALRAKGKRLLFSSYTEAEMTEWLRALHVVLRVSRHHQTHGKGRLTDLYIASESVLQNQQETTSRLQSTGKM